MRIKRVEINGFKSFCDRTVVRIDSPINAIVGPNGCGKSNIVDAIRWCMGEQSAKHLRGKAMEDVIFAGSEHRGPAPMAEVSLTFDDVGFSHATLETAMTSDEAQAAKALEEIAPGEEVVEAAGEGEGEGEPAAEAPAAPTPISDEIREFIEDKPLDIDFSQYNEVTITRRLYRDGTSQYLINKTPCRLRDVTDFFLGTGVGTKAYAIIEQGRIGQIVSSRPQDRRAIIEEAAGITKFKAKKKAAERKLEQTKQNLLRVSDIVVELDKRMGTLRRQAQKAERYRAYKTELRDLDLWKAAHRFLELGADDRMARTRFERVRSELGDTRIELEAKDAGVVAERADLAVEERRLLALQESVFDLDNRLQLAASKIEFEGREAAELENRIAQAGNEIDSLGVQRAEAAARLKAEQEELAALADEVARGKAEEAERDAAAFEGRTQLSAAQARLDQARAELATAGRQIATAEAQREALVRRRDEATRRFERVREETNGLAERLAEVERETKRVDAALGQARQTRMDLGEQEAGFESKRAVLADDVERGEAEVETLRDEAHRRRSRLASLVEIQDRYEGFARGTRAVMQRSGALSDQVETGGRIQGLVADVVRAPESLEVAVEAALGDRLGGVLIDEPKVGLAAIGYLKSSGGGRSAFVPAIEMASASSGATMGAGERGGAEVSSGGGIEFEDRSQLMEAHVATGGEGVLGKMADLVQFSEGFGAVASRLLGDITVVDTLERALELHQMGAPGTLVSVDGDVVDPRGVISGGSRDSQGAGVLAQKREIRDLEEIVASLDSDLAAATARLVQSKTELRQVEKTLENLRRDSHQGELAIIGLEKDFARLRTEADRHRERLGQLGGEQIELEERLRQIGADEAAVQEKKQAAEDTAAQGERLQLDLMGAVTAGTAQLEQLLQALTGARVRAAQLGEKRSSLETTVLRMNAADRQIGERLARLAADREVALARVAELVTSQATASAEATAWKEQRMAVAGELDQGRQSYEHRLSEIMTAEIAVRELRSKVDQLTAESSQLEVRLAHLAESGQHLCEAIAERYQVHVPSILSDYHLRPLTGDKEDARIKELRELIERMGADINLTAIEEFGEVSTRFEFLSTQKADLEHAVSQLERAIDKINKTSRRLFKDTFAAVNAKFQEVFPRLFRGGNASLSLSGSDDLLEAGVDIMAQPPGKKNSTVEQLSGGEKALTAVALVFSIFLIKPSPFCILDEVDAPLDEANVDRYNELVREMTDRSQFIVISHNKRTMESADNLYGVTMQEPGVSKLVTVNLNKIGKTPVAA